MRTGWQFQTAGQLVFGAGAVRQAGPLLSRRGWRRVLVITDPPLRKAGIAAKVEQVLRSAGIDYQVFDAGEPEPSLRVAEEAIAEAHRFRPAAILGLGGGSNMDLAKIVAAVATHGGSPRDYFGFDRVPGPVTPLVCIPTTAGTGSEVSHAAVLTDTDNKIKVSTLSPHLRPALAIVDPELTYSCPPRLTADSGIDALTHAIEAYTATRFDQMEAEEGALLAYEGAHPLGACLAEKAIALIAEHLISAVRDGDNVQARQAMAVAATLAGMAFSSCGVALVHGLEYPIGGELHCTHGAGNGLLLPFVMRFNLPYRTDAFAQIAQLMGADTRSLSPEQAAEQAVHAVEQLRAAIGIPQRLRDIGARPEQLPDFAAKSFAIKRLLQTNPRPANEADLLDILRQAY